MTDTPRPSACSVCNCTSSTDGSSVVDCSARESESSARQLSWQHGQTQTSDEQSVDSIEWLVFEL